VRFWRFDVIVLSSSCHRATSIIVQRYSYLKRSQLNCRRLDVSCGTYTFDRPEQAPLVHPWQTEDVKAGISHLLLQVQGGQHKIIAPDELAEVKIKPAPWF